MEAGVVERGLGDHYSIGIESRRQRLQVDQGADEQAGSGQQHDGEGDLAGNQRLAQAHAADSGCGAAGHRGAQVNFARGERTGACQTARWSTTEIDERKCHHAAVEGYAGDREKVFGQQQQEAAQGDKAHTDRQPFRPRGPASRFSTQNCF